ncbi:glycosyltransferase [Leifsonia sp. AK011]|uniref:glycosyltransferase n=1 Tax=Leifsonia sp. AK011 TaxID=2723075 RepID=UPI0035B61581
MVDDRIGLSGRRHSFGLSQFLLPAIARTPWSHGPRDIRFVTSQYARRVARISPRADVFHFIEGLGYRSLRQTDFALSICERRNFHHAVYESPLEPNLDFPENAVPDPIGAILEEEYSRADRILVYSEVARESFLSRGFDPLKVSVAPIGLGSQLPQTARRRDPHLFLYVGRGNIFKGIDVAVAAITSLGQPYRLVVAGPASAEVQRWLRQFPNVAYRGILGREALRELYSTASALLSPSVESFGLAAWEGIGHGLRLIASDTMGATEYIPAHLRTVLVGRDVQAWCEAVLANDSSIDDETRRRDGLAAVNAMSWERASSALDSIYTDPQIGQ